MEHIIEVTEKITLCLKMSLPFSQVSSAHFAYGIN